MLRKTLVSAMLLLCGAANAGVANISWTNATTNTDGSPIPATCTTSPCGKLVQSVVEYGTCNGTNVFGTKQGEITVTAPANTTPVNMVVVQMYCFRVFHRNDYTVASDMSNVGSKDNVPPKPNAPGVMTIAGLTVFQVIGSPNKFALVPVGTAPPDTKCDATQSVNGRYAVPRESVSWFGSVRPQVVVAECG